MDGFILSIDQGTSGTKAIIFDRKGRIVASGYHELHQYYPQQGWVEQDASEIWYSTIQAISTALANARILPEDIRAIGISNQRSTTVVWNKTTGEPIGRAIGWQDRRTQSICDSFSEADEVVIEEKTGLKVVTNLSATKLSWLLKEDRSVQKALARGQLLFGTIDSWLIWKFSRGQVHLTDYSNACTTGLLNMHTLQYDDWMLEKFGIPPEILPRLADTNGFKVQTAPEEFFGISVPITSCIGDQSAAAFGQACYKPGMIKNTYGTGAFMVLNTGGIHYQPTWSGIAPILWVMDGKPVFGIEGYADISGAVVQWLKDGMGLLKDISEADGLAMQEPDTGGVYFVPALVGLGAPYNSPNARGTIFGINLSTNKSHIIRAAIEAIAYQTYDSIRNLEKAYPIHFSSLRVDGGGARSDFLLQFQADILGIPVERPCVIEAAALGAAYLAGLAIGYWQSIEEVEANWQLASRFEPRISSVKRDDLYGGWLEAVRCAREWKMVSKLTPGHQSDASLVSLSPREKEVVLMLADGKSTREIADLLFTSIKTVEKQRRDAMRKLGVESLAALLKMVLADSVSA